MSSRYLSKYLIHPKDPRVAAIELALIDFAWTRPDSIVVDEKDWFQVTTPSSQEPHLNGVVFSSVDGEQGVARIRSTIEEYRRRKVQFRWIVSPSSLPKNLEAILESEGMKQSYECDGMVRSTDTAAFPPINPGINVIRVGPADVADYAKTCALGWGGNANMEATIKSDMEHATADMDDRIQYFLARIDGRLAATAVLCLSENSGYLKGTSVVPSERGKGVYRAILQHRLEILNQLGISMVTIQAISDTSAPICRKMGFAKVCSTYEYHGE